MSNLALKVTYVRDGKMEESYFPLNRGDRYRVEDLGGVLRFVVFDWQGQKYCRENFRAMETCEVWGN